MKMTGHKTESVYRRYAIVDAAMLRESAANSRIFTILGEKRVQRTISYLSSPLDILVKNPTRLTHWIEVALEH